MKPMRALVVLLLSTLAGCASSSSVGYVDAVALPDGFLGSSHRAWLEDSRILVEVNQIPGLNVVGIRHRIEGDAVYLLPERVSSGGGGTHILAVDISSVSLTHGWKNRVYWLTRETFYPMTTSGFWNASVREPSERVKLHL